METNQLIGYLLAIFIGITLGLIGSGGSILSVPILTYIMGVEPVLATAYSLFVVGTTALVGGLQKAHQKLVDFKKVLLFGLPTLVAVFLTRKFLVPAIPQAGISLGGFDLRKPVLIMSVFAVVMVIASVKMIRPVQEKTSDMEKPINYGAVVLQGLLIGLVAGFVGAGGGFLIIPALLFLARTPMKIAVGTSLFIIAIQSLVGFTGDLGNGQPIDWKLLLAFTACSVLGIFIGGYVSRKMSGERLKTGFGWFVLLMGLYILLKEIVLK